MRRRGSRFEEHELEDEPAPEVDLHGLHPERALEQLELFLHRSRVGGQREVVVVTGAGRSNGTGRAVLRERVEDWLRDATGERLGVEHVERIAKGGALRVRLRTARTRP